MVDVVWGLYFLYHDDMENWWENGKWDFYRWNDDLDDNKGYHVFYYYSAFANIMFVVYIILGWVRWVFSLIIFIFD